MNGLEVFLLITLLVLSLYYVVYHVGTLALIGIAARRISREARWPAVFSGIEVFSNPMTPTVTVIVPAHNEEAGIVPAVESLRNLRYPALDIIVVDDGSKDRTVEVLREAFALEPAHFSAVDDRVPQEGETLAEYRSTDGTRLHVISKVSKGRRADAVNAGLRAAQGELVCMIDADSMLAPDALLRLALPFIDDPRVVAAGGTILPANGMTFQGGNPVGYALPKKWIERFQVVEYLRAFLLGRSGWSGRNGLTIISGAFGLYRREAIFAVGGLTAESLAEDADLLLSVHMDAVEAKRPYSVVFDARAVCWTEVPSRMDQLKSQRIRWAQGLDEILVKFRGLMFNRRYGVLGNLALPWLFLYEYLAPLVAAIGVILTVVLLTLGGVGASFMSSLLGVMLLFVCGIGLSALVGIAALVVDMLWFKNYSANKQFWLLLATTLLEPVFYRPFTFVWQLKGILRGRLGKASEWGVMERTGHASAAAK